MCVYGDGGNRIESKKGKEIQWDDDRVQRRERENKSIVVERRERKKEFKREKERV